MNSKFFILILTSNITIASSVLPDIKKQLHHVSTNIDNSISYDGVIDSLYQQIRPRANITDKTLSSEQIDSIVKTYVKDKYAPALIGNYKHLYTKLTSANKDFSSCENPKPIEPDNEVLVSLCIKQKENAVHIIYMTNRYNNAWSQSMDFVFKSKENKLLLCEIELILKDGVKTYIEGI